MNLNKVFIIGRLTQEPEARSTASGQNVTTLRMATNRVWNNQSTGQKQEATEYHTVIAWGRLGEIASQYLKRGGLVMIEGRLQTRSWQGQDGNKRYNTEIVAEGLQLGPRTAGVGTGEQSARTAPQAHTAASPVADADIPIINENELANAGLSGQGVEEETVKVKDEDLPF
ncbi:MAG: single-stranded DNA-binding protein [Candidatus Yanofskybacteria bacterium]|nr:single-stranded DNA-binding protein [Candidatus Yanofskybacteria bacterium]